MIPDIDSIQIITAKLKFEDENSVHVVVEDSDYCATDIVKRKLNIDPDDDYSDELEVDSFESLTSCLASRLVYPECRPLNETDRSEEEKAAPANLDQLQLISGRIIGWDEDFTALVENDEPISANEIFNAYLAHMNGSPDGEPTAITDIAFMSAYSMKITEHSDPNEVGISPASEKEQEAPVITATNPNDVLRQSALGSRLERQAKERVVSSVFDLSSGDINDHIPRTLPREKIFDAILESQALTIEIDGKQYTLNSYHSVSVEDVVAMLEDDFYTVYDAMIDAASQAIAEVHLTAKPESDTSCNQPSM